MENTAHTLCGLALARAGLDRLSPWAAPLVVVAANFPDADVVGTAFGGRAWYLCHHRGLTHSLLGLALESLLLAGACYGIGRRVRSAEAPPLRFRGLWAAALVGLLSHLLLDSLNTYGVRPFLPFADTHYYGDIAFIVDPWLWLLLGFAACLGAPKPGPDALEPERRRARRSTVGWWILLLVGSGLLLSRGAPTRWAGLVFAPALLGVLLIRLSPALRAQRRRLAWTGLALAALYLVGIGTLQRRADARARAALAAQGVEVALSTTHPGFALPWRFRAVLASEREVYALELDLSDPSPPRVERLISRNLEHPDLPSVSDSPEYAAWRSFARIPFVAELPPEEARLAPTGPQLRGPGAAPSSPAPARARRLVLGDARYAPRPSAEWPNLVVSPQPAGPSR